MNTPTFDPSDEDESKKQPSSGREENAPVEGIEDAEEQSTLTPNEEGSEGKGRSAESRIKELIAEKKAVEKELLESKAREKAPTLPGQEPALTDEQIKAISLLKGMGFVQKTDVKNEIDSLQSRLVLDTEHTHLEDKYDGSDGRPKYDRSEVEAYMRANGIYKPEVAYKDMNEQELIDWHLKESSSSKKNRPYMTPPASPGKGDEGAITREKIAEMQGKPIWREWYEKNRTKILSLMAEHKL